MAWRLSCSMQASPLMYVEHLVPGVAWHLMAAGGEGEAGGELHPGLPLTACTPLSGMAKENSGKHFPAFSHLPTPCLASPSSHLSLISLGGQWAGFCWFHCTLPACLHLRALFQHFLPSLTSAHCLQYMHTSTAMPACLFCHRTHVAGLAGHACHMYLFSLSHACLVGTSSVWPFRHLSHALQHCHKNTSGSGGEGRMHCTAALHCLL